MQVVDVNGNMFGYDYLEVIGINGKPKTPGGGGGPYVPYTGATGNVDLGTHTLSAKDLIINHPSGSGVAVSITKGGSGEALKVVKTSGSGNAASITGGVTLLDELHLTTDLSDSYISSAATWNAKQEQLVSGTNIKTINGSSVLGTGNLVVSGGGGGGGTHTPFKFNSYLSNLATSGAVNGISIGNFSMSANQCIAYPYIPKFSFTANAFYLNVPVGVVGNLGRILVYQDTNGLPTTKLFESANLDLGTSGVKTASTTFTFTAGTIYWLAFHCNAVPSGSISGISVANAISFAFLTITPITALSRNVTFGSSSPSPMNPNQSINSILPFIGITSA